MQYMHNTYTINTEYNQQWNVFSAFNPSKCTHIWSSGLAEAGSSWGFGALLKGLTSVVDNSSGYKSNALSIRDRASLDC